MGAIRTGCCFASQSIFCLRHIGTVDNAPVSPPMNSRVSICVLLPICVSASLHIVLCLRAYVPACVCFTVYFGSLLCVQLLL